MNIPRKTFVTLVILGFIAVGSIIAITTLSENDRNKHIETESKTSEPIRIGLLLPLTGDGAVYGVPIQNAALLAQTEINEAGGINGRKIEFIAEDGKCEPAAAAAAAQKLVSVNKVTIVLGGACSGEVLGSAPIFEEAKVLSISPSATNPDITQAGDYIFRTAPSDNGQGEIAAEYAYNTLGARKIAILSEQTEYAQGLRRVFRNRFEEFGGEIVEDEVFQSSDTDLRSQVLKIKNANADVIYIVQQTRATAELIVKQLTAQDVTTQLLGEEGLLDREMLTNNPALFSGIIATEPYFNESEPRASSFLFNYETNYGEKPPLPSYMTNMYSQVYLIKEGIESVGEDAEALKNWLYTIQEWEHAFGTLTFTSQGDRIGKYSIKKIQADGSLKNLILIKPQ